MIKETDLCLGCMEKKGAGNICPHCGYDQNSSHISSYLAPGTVLQGRYLTGRLVCYNGESGLYIGFDFSTEKKVTIREYMPDSLCSREEDKNHISVHSDGLPLYKTYLSEFVELHRTLMNSDGIGNIQPVLDVFIANNTAYAVMDYIEGIGLKTYLSSCGDVLDWEQAKKLFSPVLTSLGMIHSLGIIHRGLSLNTLIVTEKNELRIIGFGISASRTADSDIACEVYPGYAAPEQYFSARRNGSWTDIYGISAVLYRCLTGVTPPSAEERLENDTLVEPALINRAVPTNVSKVIMMGLRLEAGDRIATVNEFVDRLFEQPQPVTDSSTEIHVPTRHYSSGKSRTRSGNVKAQPSRTSMAKKKKKKKDNGSFKYIFVCCAMLVIIIIFLLAIIIPALSGGEPEDAEQTTEETTTQATTTTIAVTDPPEESTATSSAPMGEGYILPDFVGRSFDSVNGNAKYSYITFVPKFDFNNEYASGEIFYQDVQPDTIVYSGITVNVKVSKGAEKVPLPDFADMTVEEYKELLGSLNIKYETAQEETSEVKEGYVVRCSVPVGTEINVANGETVTVYTALTPVETTPVETTTAETTVEPFIESEISSNDNIIPSPSEDTQNTQQTTEASIENTIA